ncbi:MAG TPA: prenyltransferase [Rhodocyclaceae bacterium]|jgi:1,4-dihydroxy-2-naphthoate octaprenyltransferase
MSAEVLSHAPGEPSRESLPGPLLRFFLATRPAFLTITFVGVVLGLACAWRSHLPFTGLTALVTLLFALIAHAGANVINDFHDRDTDDLNTERLFPFTGGSRFIQNGVLSPRAIALLGYGLLASVIPAGLWLISQVGVSLFWIGLIGLFVGWAYSAPPLRLAARGLGELAIALGWALVVVGSDFVQRGAFELHTIIAGLSFGLMVANLLYINQFPDAVADAAAGKRTVVARLGRRAAVGGYAVIAVCAAFNLLAAVAVGLFPLASLIALLAMIPAFKAWRLLRDNAENPAALRPAIQATIAAAHLFGLLLAAALAFA